MTSLLVKTQTCFELRLSGTQRAIVGVRLCGTQLKSCNCHAVAVSCRQTDTELDTPYRSVHELNQLPTTGACCVNESQNRPIESAVASSYLFQRHLQHANDQEKSVIQ